MTALLNFPQRMRPIDWQALSADRLAPLYAGEVDRWLRLLDWDTAGRWEDVERQRRQGLAPGVAVLDEAGVVHGWSHYTVRNGALRIEAFAAASEPVAQLMLDRLLNDQALVFITRVSLFAFSEAPGLVAALRRKGLSVDRYWYLGREIARTPPPMTDARGWRIEDLPATAALLARGYEARVETRPFAPGGTIEEWTAYLRELLAGSPSGPLLPEASLCIPGGPNRLSAVALVSRIADATAHLVQLVVDPEMQRRRLGLQLMECVSASAARAGCRLLTVHVGGSNRRARSLFEASRFRTMGNFLAAGTLQPRRSTSVAPGGAVMTRR
jgi:ribosomal protein S18 acetylase RimI-like enzyme